MIRASSACRSSTWRQRRRQARVRLASNGGADMARLMTQLAVGSMIRVSFVFLDDVAALCQDPFLRPVSDRLAFTG
jgi:hypothetical protein